MLTEERRKRIAQMLLTEDAVKVEPLAEEFEVSLATIRRDLAALEEEGVLRRVYGGAVSLQKPISSNIRFQNRMNLMQAEKAAIGRLAASLVQPGDTVLLDVGSTTLEVARALKDRQDVTVLTISLPILNELVDSPLNVYSLSGRMRKAEFTYVGNVVSNALQPFHINKAFIGCGGYTLEYGMTEYVIESAQNRNYFIEQCDEAILVADSNKFGKNVSILVENSSYVKTIVTDNGLPEDMHNKLQERGIHVLLAKPER